MASSRPPPPAASQEVVPPPNEDDGLFNDIRVATYNVGASQDDAFTSSSKLEGFKKKLKESSKGETGGRACIHHPKGFPRGRAHPSGGARPLPAWPFGRWVPNVRSGLPRPGGVRRLQDERRRRVLPGGVQEMADVRD